MSENMKSKRPLMIVLAAVLCALLMAACCGLSACSGSEKKSYPEVVIGTLATEDILPMWVAEEEGMFEEAGLQATVQVFQSATELIAGITSGEVDYAMTDPMVTASIYASGTEVQIRWITLGTEASQGRFGLMSAEGTGITEVSQLAGKSIGVGSNTILEYVMDCLLADAGITEGDFTKEELQKLPVRYQEMQSGQVDAAALPASLLALGEANGCVTVIDDTQGKNLSQSVMISRNDFFKEENGEATLEVLKGIWDKAAKKINESPESYRALLVEKTNLSDSIASTYPVQTYPTCQLPTNEMIDPILAWMQDKGYLSQALSYDASTGAYQAA